MTLPQRTARVHAGTPDGPAPRDAGRAGGSVAGFDLRATTFGPWPRARNGWACVLQTLEECSNGVRLSTTSYQRVKPKAAFTGT